jgi:hypothetical protein
MYYVERQSEVRERLGIPETPSSLVDRWSSFVEECEDGYGWDYSEYLNELRVRDQLGALLDAPELAAFPEHAELAQRVGAVDERLRALFFAERRTDVQQPWWHAGILQKAGRGYAEYCRKVFSAPVESAD